MLEVIPFIALGIISGTVTGMFPGIHVNTVVSFILSMLPLLVSYFSPLQLVAFIISMVHVHSYVDYIPSIFLGAPDEESSLSVLPGHRLLLKGRGYEAVRLTAIGSVGATLICILLLPAAIFIIPKLYSLLSSFIFFVLLFFVLYMVIREEGRKKIFAFLVLAYSGALGMIILKYNLLEQNEALFPAFTGLFGVSTLLISLRGGSKIPEQDVRYESIESGKSVAGGSLAGVVSGFIPALSSSEAAGVMQAVFGKGDEKDFLVSLGSINTAEAMYAIFSLYLIGRPRSGAAIGIEEILGKVSLNELYFMAAVFLLTTFFAVVITLSFAKMIAKRIEKINYALIAKATILFVAFLVLLLSGAAGFLVLVVATFIGLIPQLSGINRTTCMGVLMIPALVYFSGMI